MNHKSPQWYTRIQLKAVRLKRLEAHLIFEYLFKKG